MNKIIYVSAAVLGSLTLASCSSDDVPQTGATDGNVTFEVKLPAEVTTRAYFGEGNLAKNLYVAVYDANGKLLSNLTNFNGNALPDGMVVNNFGAESLTTTVTIPLVKNENYKIVFWADSYTPTPATGETPAVTGPFTYTPATGAMTVDYTKFVGNSDVPDAFYACVDVTADGTTHPTVELKRPFAQINIGTDDYSTAEKAGLTVNKAGMIINGVSNVVNLLDGSISKTEGFNSTVSFAATAAPKTMQFPVTTGAYEYLAMGYVLCGDSQTAKGNLDHVQLMLNDGTQAFATYDNVPAQSNFRTNIYGSLLTNKENFTVTINPVFLGINNVAQVNTREEMVAAIQNGSDVKLNKDITIGSSLGKSLQKDKPVQIDLAGHNLTLSYFTNLNNNAISFVNTSEEKSTINIKRSGSVLGVYDGSKVHVKNVDIVVAQSLTGNGGASSPIFIDGDNAEVIIEDCTINYRDYAISTNANSVHEGMTLTLNNVKMIPIPESSTACAAFLFNVPMTVNATKCLFQGINQGGIFRGGTFNFANCTIEQILVPEGAKNGLKVTTKDDIKVKFRNSCRNGDWGTGSGVPLAALTVGNRGPLYQYATNVTLKNCKLIVPEVARNTNNDIDSSLPAMYVYANQGAGLGVNITMDGCTYNEVLEFASTNIIYNGTAITTTPYYVQANAQ